MHCMSDGVGAIVAPTPSSRAMVTIVPSHQVADYWTVMLPFMFKAACGTQM
jgi:hypothetical protein